MRLSCSTDIGHCIAPAKGQTYDAELSGKTVWIDIATPLTHEVKQAKFRIEGSW